jgi:hypothetical protein
MESCFFVGILFFALCGVSFNVLSRSVLPFFRRGSIDENVLRSLNFGACMVRIPSMPCFVYSIVVYEDCKHPIFCIFTWIFSLALISFRKAIYVRECLENVVISTDNFCKALYVRGICRSFGG